jgi:predicted outer membrane protein
MKHFVLGAVAVVALSVSISSIGFTQVPADTVFLTKAIEENSVIIDLARMAQTRSQNAEVRNYANMLVQDHTQAFEKLHNAMNNGMNPGITKGMNKNNKMSKVQLTKEQQQTVARLSKLTGPAFDRAFIDEMVKDHQKDIQLFEQEAGTTVSDDTDLNREKPSDTPTAYNGDDSPNNANNAQAVARELLPTLRNHLKQAEQLQQTLK